MLECMPIQVFMFLDISALCAFGAVWLISGLPCVLPGVGQCSSLSLVETATT